MRFFVPSIRIEHNLRIDQKGVIIPTNSEQTAISVLFAALGHFVQSLLDNSGWPHSILGCSLPILQPHGAMS